MLEDDEFFRLLAARQAKARESRPRGEATSWPVSPLQHPLIVAEQMFPGTLQYQVAQTYRISSHLDVSRLGAAIEALSERHRTLRAVLQDSSSGETRWHLVTAQTAPLLIEPATAEPDHEWMVRVRSRSFDLWRETPFRAHLAPLHDGQFLFALVAHHAAVDGLSWATLERDLSAEYERQGLDSLALSASAPAPSSYASYLESFSREHGLPTWEQAEAYWRHALSSPPPPVRLPDPRSRPRQRTDKSEQLEERLDGTLIDAVARRAREQRIPQSAVYLAAVGHAVCTIAGRPDLIIGVPHSDRRESHFDSTVGMFVNTLPIRLRIRPEEKPTDVLATAAAALSGAIAHGQIPFARIVEISDAPYQTDTTPLVQVLFGYQDFQHPGLRLGEASVTPIDLPEPATQFDCAVTLRDLEIGSALRVQWNPDVITHQVINSLIRAIRSALERLAGSFDTDTWPTPPRSEFDNPVNTHGEAPSPTGVRQPTQEAAEPPGNDQLDETDIEITETVRHIWAEVLARPPHEIEADSDFFDLGGDSLLAARAKTRLKRRGLIVTLPTLFDHPLLSDFVRHVTRAQDTSRSPAEAPPEPDRGGACSAK